MRTAFITLLLTFAAVGVRAEDFSHWTAEQPAKVLAATANSIGVAYVSPQFAPVVIRPASPLPLPAGTCRVRFWCARVAGDFDLSLQVRDGSGREHMVATFDSRPTFPGIRRFQMADWSVWRQVESTNLAPPTDIAEHVLPEFQPEVRKFDWPQPLSLVGILVRPARDRRDNEAWSDVDEIRQGHGQLWLTDLSYRTGDGFAARFNWFLEGRWRWGWDVPPRIFLDDMTRRSGRVRYAVELQHGYQGQVVWRKAGSADIDRKNPMDIFADRIELPDLPAGRYFVTTKAWGPNGVFDLSRTFQLWVASGPKRTLAPVDTPLRWETAAADHVFPPGTTTARLTLAVAPEEWSVAGKQAVCAVTVVDWWHQTIYEHTYARAAVIHVDCPGVRSGTDYTVTAELRAEGKAYDRAALHFGVASAPADEQGSAVPASVPTRDDMLMSRRAWPVAELFGSLMSDENEASPLTTEKLGEFDQWLDQAAGYGFKTASFYFGWGETEPLPGVYRWDEIARRIALARAHGMNVLLTPTEWGDPLEWPEWLQAQPVRDQYGYIAADRGNHFCAPSFWDAAARDGYKGWLTAVARRFVTDPTVVGYRTKALIYMDDNRPEMRRTDYSPPAREAFAKWLTSRGKPQTPMPSMFQPFAAAPDRGGPDLSSNWQEFMDFRVYSYEQSVHDILSAIRQVDPRRQIHVYRGPQPTACEAAIPLLRDGAEFHDEGGPFYFQRAMESLCLQEGVPYTNEGHQFTPPSIALADSTLFYGSCFDHGWYWLYRWNIHRSEDKRFAALPEVLKFIEDSMPAQREWVSAAGEPPQVLVFGSRADRLLGDGRLGFYSNISGVDVFTALFSYHQIQAHFADEYADWVDLSRFRVVFAVGDIMPEHAIDRLADAAAKGVKIILVGDAGKYCPEHPNERDLLQKRLANLPNVRRIAAPDIAPPAPGAAFNSPTDFPAAELTALLAWAGVTRPVWTEKPGFECVRKASADSKRVYVAVFRRWPGSYDNVWYDDQAKKRRPPEATPVVVAGMGTGKWRLEKFHRTVKAVGTVTAANGEVRFTADPATAGELQLFRLTAE